MPGLYGDMKEVFQYHKIIQFRPQIPSLHQSSDCC